MCFNAYIESRWGLSALRTLVHSLESGFQMPGEPPGIDKRRREAVFRELVLWLGKQSGIARELERQSFVVFQRTGDEFGHLDRAEQGGGNAGCEAIAKTCDYRNTATQSVARGRMTVPIDIIKEKVGKMRSSEISSVVCK